MLGRLYDINGKSILGNDIFPFQWLGKFEPISMMKYLGVGLK